MLQNIKKIDVEKVKRMTKQLELKDEKIWKLLLKFSIPAIIGMMVNALYNVVDRMYIGRLGALAMTGIGLNLPFMTILMAFGMLVGIGSGAIISIRLGQNKKEEAEKILGDDMPIGMLYFRQKVFLVNPELKNMKFKPVGSEYYLIDAYIE